MLRGSMRVGAVVALVISAVACSSGDDDGDAAVGGVPGTQILYGAEVTALEGEVWVHGGLAADPGTAPPMTSGMPPGWEPNRRVLVYGPDGERRAEHLLPDGTRQAPFARVVTDGSSSYLVANVCPAGCGRGMEPGLFRLDGRDTERIALDGAVMDFPRDAGGSGLVETLGAADGTAWLLQRVGPMAGDASQHHRLWAIDLATGDATEVPLPDPLTTSSQLCLGDGSLHLAVIVTDDAAATSRLDILRTPAAEARGWETGSAEWSLVRRFADQPLGGPAGPLNCLDGLGQLSYSISARQVTIDASTGVGAAPVQPLEGGIGGLVGVVDGQAVAYGKDAAFSPVLWLYRPGGSWEIHRIPPDHDVLSLRVVDGALYDVSGASTSTDPDHPLRRVDL